MSIVNPGKIKLTAQELGITEEEVKNRLSALFSWMREVMKEHGMVNVPETDEGMALFLQMNTTREDLVKGGWSR